MIELKVADVSRETSEKMNQLMLIHKHQLTDYARRLLRWNDKINVISRNTTEDELMNHIRHSLYLSEYIAAENHHIIDAGSGGGLPGIPLGIIYSDKKIHLIDVVAKKMLLTDAVRREMGLMNINSKHISISDFDPPANSILVSKHAFKIADLLNMISGRNYESILMLKGDDYMEELKNIEKPVKIEVYRIDAVEKAPFFHGKCIVKIEISS